MGQLTEGHPKCTQHKPRASTGGPPSTFTDPIFASPGCLLSQGYLLFLLFFPSLLPFANFYHWPPFSSNYFLLIFISLLVTKMSKQFLNESNDIGGYKMKSKTFFLYPCSLEVRTVW